MEMTQSRKLGNYLIKNLIGQGPNSQAYRASHQWTGQDSVVKIFPEGFFSSLEYRYRMDKNIRILAIYDLPPALAPVEDFQLEGEQPYLVTRYFPGGNLTSKLADGPLSLEDAFWVATQVAFGLDFLHQNGILHSNLKPENILFDLERQPHLTDYDIIPPQEPDLQ